MFWQMVHVEHKKLTRRKILWIEMIIVAAAAVLIPLVVYLATQSDGEQQWQSGYHHRRTSGGYAGLAVCPAAGHRPGWRQWLRRPAYCHSNWHANRPGVWLAHDAALAEQRDFASGAAAGQVYGRSAARPVIGHCAICNRGDHHGRFYSAAPGQSTIC